MLVGDIYGGMDYSKVYCCVSSHSLEAFFATCIDYRGISA